MKKFEWVTVEHTQIENNIFHTLSLLEVLEDDKRQFWGSINLYPNPEWRYNFAAYNKDRILCSPGIPVDTIDEAKEAIEEYLTINGIMQEGDVIEEDE